MRTVSARGVTLFAASILVLASVACTPSGQAVQPAGGAELVKSKCTLCHSMDRINQANKDRAAWAETVERMRTAGAVLTDAEASQVVEYLAKSGAK
jgi:cytochrome c5